MQLVQNDLDSLEAVFGSAVFLSDLLARFASIDRTFRDRILDDTPDFENTIVNVYFAILVYSAEITKQSQRNIPSKFLFKWPARGRKPAAHCEALLLDGLTLVFHGYTGLTVSRYFVEACRPPVFSPSLVRLTLNQN